MWTSRKGVLPEIKIRLNKILKMRNLTELFSNHNGIEIGIINSKMNRYFTKEDIHVVNRYLNRSNIINHQGNAYQNNKISPHT